jgi:hypothetical protein
VKNQLWQRNFIISGLIPDQVKLKRKIWLKKGEVLLDKKGDQLYAYVLGDDRDWSQNEERITAYLRFCSLISTKAADVESRGATGIRLKEELGTGRVISASVTSRLPEEAVADVENYAHRFIGFIGRLHDKYINVVAENEFMEIALDYFYEAQRKFVYSNEGFISAVISLEALFNEGPADIKYKLAHRAAFLLGLCDVEPMEAFEKLKGFYNNRSKLVHGGGPIPHDPDRNLVSRYTRQSIIIFLILLRNEERRKIARNRRKSETLKEIDYAMLNEQKRSVLKKEINNGLKDFRLTIPRTFEGEGKHGKYRVTPW